MTNKNFADFETRCRSEWHDRGLDAEKDWASFSKHLDAELRRLAELLYELYGDRPDFAFQFSDLVAETFRAWQQRSEKLRKRDSSRTVESGWFLSNMHVGAIAYVDRFAGSFSGLVERIPMLRELGVTMLHLMPFFRSPENENDGGYAVTSYRDTDPRLGTMNDFEAMVEAMDRAGITIIADFVFNHTSDEHEWAMRARKGDERYRNYYLTFVEHAETAVWQASLREIFPEVRRGSFTWNVDMGRWVWTTFHSYQWDLDYRNPAVFRAMAAEMLSLANRGVGMLRLDAVAFIWKQQGTSCENLPQAHTIIKAFQAVARLAAPSLLFLSEAIVHPDDIVRYIDRRECQLSYNPLLMAELWEACATKETQLLRLSMHKRHALPAGTSWLNYVRCHDDIGWTFADEDAAELGIKGNDHRAFLNNFYLGTFPGSFSRGVSFQYNPATGDRRICGTAASLAGVEKAVEEGSGDDLDTAVRRVLLLYGMAFLSGGIPFVYLGDEIGTQNDYSYTADSRRAGDSRWVHRPLWSESRYDQIRDLSGVPGRIWSGMKVLSNIRKTHPVFSEPSVALHVLPEFNPRRTSVLAFHKQDSSTLVAIVANFAEHPVVLPASAVSHLTASSSATDLVTGKLVLPDEDMELEACGLAVLEVVKK